MILHVWEIESGECLHVLVGHLAALGCIQYDGRLAYGDMVKVWDPGGAACLNDDINRVRKLGRKAKTKVLTPKALPIARRKGWDVTVFFFKFYLSY